MANMDLKPERKPCFAEKNGIVFKVGGNITCEIGFLKEGYCDE